MRIASPKARAVIALPLALALASVAPGCAFRRSQAVSVKGFPDMRQPTELVRSWPQYGETLPSRPGVVTLTFDEPVASGSQIAVWLGGHRVDNHDTSPMIGSDKMLQTTVTSGQGMGQYHVQYTVQWRGGGSTDGEFYFVVKSVLR